MTAYSECGPDEPTRARGYDEPTELLRAPVRSAAVQMVAGAKQLPRSQQ